MKMLNTKLVLSALGIVAMLISPAFARQPYRQPSQQHTIVNSARQTGYGVYDMAPRSAWDSGVDNPGATGGGSSGYNEAVRNDS